MLIQEYMNRMILRKWKSKAGMALTAAVVLAGFGGCAESVNDNPVGVDGSIVIQPEKLTEPTTDQLGVSVRDYMPAAVMGQFDDSSTGAALVRRLAESSSDIDFNTRLVLLKGSDFESASPLTDKQLYAVVVAYMGGGYIAIDCPTKHQLENFYDAFYKAAVEVEKDLLADNFDLDEDEAEAAARSTSLADRMEARLANVSHYATRSGADPVDEVLSEMLILGPIDYFYQEPFGTQTTISTQTQDGDGPLSAAVQQTVPLGRNAYRSGLMADAAARWLNDAEQRMAETYAEAPAEARAVTRASANDAINELMNASETFTFSGKIFYRYYDNTLGSGCDRVEMTVRSWGVHNFATGKDYYYVKQNVSLNMGKKSNGDWMFGTYEGDSYWHEASGFGNYWNKWYGSFLSKYTTSMDLSGKGTIMLEAALPETENTQSTQTVNIGQSASVSETVGVTIGTTFGFQGGGPMMTVNMSGSYTYGTTQASSFSLSSSKTHKDLSPSVNREDKKVTWIYKGNLPKYRIENRDNLYWYMHDAAPEILVNTASLTNDVCWSVIHPEGRYTLNITSYPQTAALLYHFGKGDNDASSKEGHYEYTENNEDNNFSHELLQPNRSMQKWHTSLVVDEIAAPANYGQGANLENRIKAQYPNLYLNNFSIADKTNESLEAAYLFINHAKREFTQNYDILQNMARDYGIRKFTIIWTREGTTVRERFTVLGEDYNPLVADGGTDDGKNKVGSLFDSNYYTKWRAESSNKEKDKPYWIEFHAPQPVSPKSYTMVTASDAAEDDLFNPCEWKLFGKKNKTDEWTLLATVNDRKNDGDGLPWANSTPKKKLFDQQPHDMQYFRLEASPWIWAIQLAEFYFNY